ncbi:Uncharacterised protein [Vibrio cholerae]|nr:Uncharacterised protein [Vibrio cholerae]
MPHRQPKTGQNKPNDIAQNAETAGTNVGLVS